MVDELKIWMDPVELSQLLAVLHTLAPKRCLEWGSGGSTKTLLEHCGFVERWVSVEHDAAWHGNVAQAVTDPRLTLKLEEPQKPCPTDDAQALIDWCAEAEHDRSILASYIDYPASLGEPFDFVLVDGRARRFCVEEGHRLLRPGGMLVLHDAQREQYHDALRACGKPVFLEPYVQGQIALLRRG